MPVTLNKAGDAHARSLIAKGLVDKTSSWSFAAADGDKFLGDDGDDWASYAQWFLGEDSGADEKTKARYKYPFGKNGKVYRRALVAIRSRASQQGATTIYEAAGKLIELIDKNKGKDDGRAAGTRRLPHGETENRLADLKPDSYDAKAHTVKVVLSTGVAVARWYGTELLEISAAAVNLDRMSSCGVPLIDSHGIFSINGVYGRLDRAWIEGGELLGLVVFDDSDDGRKAEGMVARGMIRAVSIGYRVDVWEIKDEDGNVIDPERERLLWDEQYTFTAKRWELLEVSLVSVPADPSAVFRSAGGAASPFHDGLLERAKSVTYRNGDLAITYDFADAATAARAASPDGVIERMRIRQTMLARELMLARSLHSLG